MPTYEEFIQAARNARKRGAVDDEKRLLELAALERQAAPEIVSGTPEQMAAARARNLQVELGLEQPVVPPSEQTTTLGSRAIKSFAPNQKDVERFYDIEYGQGNWVHLGDNRYLVKTGSPDSPNIKDRWVVDNPAGLDAGDVAALAGQTPQLIAGATSALAMTPGPAGNLAKLAKLSGASAAASQLTGAVQDVLFRFATDQNIDPSEIAARRAPQLAAEFAGGVMLPVVAGKVAEKAASRSAIAKEYKAIEAEGRQAVKTLQQAGINPVNSAELGQAIRESTTNPAAQRAKAVGDYIANAVSDADRQIRATTQKALGRASQAIDAQAMQVIDAAAPQINLQPSEIVSASLAGASKRIIDDRTNLQTVFDAAMNEIDAAAKQSGAGKFFVSLNNTKKAIADLKSTPLRGIDPATGELAQIDTTPTIRGIVADLEQAAGTTQQLQAVRNIRSRLGEFIGGKADLFPGLDVGAAKKLYGALSQDMDSSISKLTGKGGDLMRQYNSEYKKLAELAETNKFGADIVSGNFNNPSDFVDVLMQGKKTDWDVAQQLIPPKTFNQVRRVVLDTMIGDSAKKVAGQDVINVAGLVRRMDSMKDAGVRDQLFGGPNGVNALRRFAERQDALQRVGGLFTRPSLPTMDEFDEAIGIAQQAGLDQANKYFDQAVSLAKSRRNGLAESLLSLSRNGNYTFSARNPEEVLDAVIFNNEIRPAYIQNFLNRMPAQQRADLGDMAFQRIFENSRNAVASGVKGNRERYDVDSIVKNVFGSKERVDAMRDLIGQKRMDMLEAWVAYDTKLNLDLSKRGLNTQRAANLVATAPYPNLFAARATSMALESIAGMNFIKKANPANIVAFPQARAALMLPTKTNADIAIIQQAINMGGRDLFNDYNTMMDELNDDQQAAVNKYLFNPPY
jgi:hypothetical protein